MEQGHELVNDSEVQLVLEGAKEDDGSFVEHHDHDLERMLDGTSSSSEHVNQLGAVAATETQLEVGDSQESDWDQFEEDSSDSDSESETGGAIGVEKSVVPSVDEPQSIRVDACRSGSSDGSESGKTVTRFVLLGDIGEDKSYRGDRARYSLDDPHRMKLNREDVRDAIQQVSGSLDFGLFLGDNFYPYGIVGDEENREEQWEDLKETYLPLKIPFLSCLGNHDHAGDSRAQVLFGSADKEKNPEMNRSGLRFWNMPSKFYDIRIGSIHFFVFDTGEGCDFQYMFENSAGYEYQDIQRQVMALKPKVLASDAPWKIAVGHIPCISDFRGPQKYLEPLKALVEENMHAYLSGHCHTLQVLNLTNETQNGPLQIISGCAGNEGLLGPYPYANAMYRSPRKSRGFFLAEATDETLLFRSFVLTSRGKPPCEEYQVTLQRSDKSITPKFMTTATPAPDPPPSTQLLRKLQEALGYPFK